MGKLPTLVSQRNGSISSSAKWSKGLLSNIYNVLLAFKKHPAVSFGAAILTNALIALSIYRFMNLINKRYKKEKKAELHKPQYYDCTLEILEKAEEAHKELFYEAGEAFYGASEPDASSSKAQGIINMPKTAYQLTGIIGSAIALALSILSLCSCAIYSLFKNQMKAPFSNRCCIFFSSLIALLSIVLQKSIIYDSAFITYGSALTLKKKISIPLYYNRDKEHFERLKHSASIKYTKFLSCASFFHLVAAYRAPNILGTPIFIVCTNLCFALHKFILDYRYICNCNIVDRTTRMIVIDAPIEVTDNSGASQSKKLSQIIVSGKISKLIDELEKRYSTLENITKKDTEYQYRKYQYMSALQMIIVRCAIESLKARILDNRNIEIRIHPSSIEDTKDIAASLHTFDGTVAIIDGNTANNTVAIGGAEITTVKKFKGDEFEMSNQCLIFKYCQLEDLLGNLCMSHNMNTEKEKRGISITLADFVATIIAANDVDILNNQEVEDAAGEISMTIPVGFELETCMQPIVEDYFAFNSRKSQIVTLGNSLKSHLEHVKGRFEYTCSLC